MGDVAGAAARRRPPAGRGGAAARGRGGAALGITTLTLYAFSADNWKRPAAEVTGLMQLFDEYLRAQARECQRHGIRLTLVGRRDRLAPALRERAETFERTTAAGTTLHLRLAIDYSAREAIWLAAERLVREGHASREAFSAAVRSGSGAPADVPDVDLLIRTGGEQRLSDFLLWESAYAELAFSDTPWPDFTGDDLAAAVSDFARRERRFGGLRKGSEKSSRTRGSFSKAKERPPMSLHSGRRRGPCNARPRPHSK